MSKEFNSQWLRDYERRDKASRSPSRGDNRDNPARVRPDQPKQAQGETLERAVSGEATRPPRFEICFHVYAVQPCDWDNYHIKELQDLVVKIGLVSSDGWQTLRGRIISDKAASKEEERTVITINQL
jgi:hypothetical protein